MNVARSQSVRFQNQPVEQTNNRGIPLGRRFRALAFSCRSLVHLLRRQGLAHRFRIRAAGAGIGAFYTPTAFGTQVAEGKETRRIGDTDYVLEYPIHADYALIKADRADRWGNLAYRMTARNFGPIMAAAARITVAQVRETVPLGELDPEVVVTRGILVQRIVRIAPLRKAA